MDTEVKSLANIKAMEGRNLDSSVDGNTLVSGEKADGTFGIFNFFKGIRNFFKGISALGTLASGSRLPVTDSNGNVTYTTMNDINSYVKNNALTNYMETKPFNSPSGTVLYITITSSESFGGILLAFDYAPLYFISSLGLVNLSGIDYGFNGYALSEDKRTIYLRITGYRKFSITNLSKSSNITISNVSGTAPSGVTFQTNWEKCLKDGDIKTTQVTGTVDVNGNMNLPINLPNRIITMYGENKLYVPFVYTSYWVAYCMNVGGTKVANGTELTVTVVYI